MKKRIIVFMMTAVLALTTLAGCSIKPDVDTSAQSTEAAETETTEETETAEATEEAEEVTEAPADETADAVSDNESETTDAPESNSDTSLGDALKNLSDVVVDKEAGKVTITFPAGYLNIATQETVDAAIKEKGYESGKLNSDGSVTFVMSNDQYEDLLAGVKKTVDDALDEMIGSEECPEVTAITHNDDYTVFTVTTKNEEVGLGELMSVITFYTLGYTYSVYSGDAVGNVHVDFVNEASGEVIYSTDSDDWGEEEE